MRGSCTWRSFVSSSTIDAADALPQWSFGPHPDERWGVVQAVFYEQMRPVSRLTRQFGELVSNGRSPILILKKFNSARLKWTWDPFRKQGGGVVTIPVDRALTRDLVNGMYSCPKR